MFKRFLFPLLFSFLSLSSLSVLADSTIINSKAEIMVLAINQNNLKQSVVANKAGESIDISENLNGETSKTAIVENQQNNNEQTGWLLALALVGFVMLSNRRGV